MRQKKNTVIRFFMAFVCAAMMVWSGGISVMAGFGDYNNYDYDTDWDSGWSSDYSSDWDSDWDYSSSWDSDWSYSSSYGYNDYSSSGFVNYPIAVIVVILLIMFSIYKNKKAKESRNMTRQTVPQPQQQRQYQARKQIKALPDRTNEITEILKKTDENFTTNDFLTYVKKVYVDIQDAWCKRDLLPVITVLHPNLYMQTQKQIQKKIDAKIVNHLDRITVNTAYLSGFRRDDDYEYMTVYLTAQMIDYQVNEVTGQIVYGDKTTRWDMQYKMIFVRAAGTQTPDALAEENNDVLRCPSCGAPVEGTAFGKCEYCGNTVSSGKYGWVLSDFAAMREDTRDEGIHVEQEQGTE